MARFARLALSINAAALLAACGGSQPVIGALGAVPQTQATVTYAEHGTTPIATIRFGGPITALALSSLG